MRVSEDKILSGCPYRHSTDTRLSGHVMDHSSCSCVIPAAAAQGPLTCQVAAAAAAYRPRSEPTVTLRILIKSGYNF